MALEGRSLDGKHVIVRRIAEGGTSTVYLGVNERIGKDVAVKVLRAASVARDPDTLPRFEREARITSRIRSAHVADVYDYGELPSGEPFMIMEYLEGESLARILERDGTIPAERLGTIAIQILDALAAAHDAGVIHRDLKPENVIVTTRGKHIIVKVIDFGISMVLDKSRIRLTSSGSVLGTPLYMSPEQARGQTEVIDQRTDLYSLGVLLYEALAGEPPLTGDNVNELLFRVALDEPQPLTTRVPSVDPVLAAIIHKAMEKALADRYQTAEEMRDAIERWRDRGTNETIRTQIFRELEDDEPEQDHVHAKRPLHNASAFAVGASVAALLLWLAPPLTRHADNPSLTPTNISVPSARSFDRRAPERRTETTPPAPASPPPKVMTPSRLKASDRSPGVVAPAASDLVLSAVDSQPSPPAPARPPSVVGR